MKKVAFLFSNNDLKFLITYFHEYEVKSEKKIINEENTNLTAGIRGNFNTNAFYNSVKYLFNDTEIHIIPDVSYLENNTYDKVFEFINYHRLNVYENKNTKKYERILINIGERTSVEDEMPSELNGNKLISGSNCKYLNSFYDYKLNLLYFYYYFGFNYLRYKYRKVEKQNMLGMYWFPFYKSERDEQVVKIKTLSSFPLDFYSDTKELNTFECMRIMDRDNWERNHISSWTDYETSVVGYIFETLHHTIEYNSHQRIEYLGEKSLKPLLFSFLKMPFILDCNPYSFIELHKDGFWFLNSEFFNYNEDDDVVTLTNNFSKSLDESVKFLESIYNNNLGNLEKISTDLYNQYKTKIDNNFSKIIEDVNYPKNGESLLNFILK
jgi:hypothetical protein